MRALFAFALIAAAVVPNLSAQSPSATPVVLQAITPAAATAPVTNTPPAKTALAALPALQQLKATNEAILAKQKATLQQLEELEKAAEQIKIYTKRN